MTDTAQAIKLVKEVEKHPCLYDTTLAEYYKSEDTEEAWAEVAKAVNLDENEVKDKWQNFRTVYRRVRDRSNNNGKPYYLAEAMKFCDPFLKPRNPVYESTATAQIQDTAVEEHEEKFNNTNPFVLDTHSVTDYDDVEEECVQKNAQTENIKKYLTEYLAIKKAKMEESAKESVQDSNNKFLLSLLPHLDAMTSAQLRNFKRRSIGLIEEILEEAYII